MNVLLLVLAYLLGFFFSLGFWLEDCEGVRFLRPLLLALIWPLVALVPLAFSAGCGAARKWRAS